MPITNTIRQLNRQKPTPIEFLSLDAKVKVSQKLKTNMRSEATEPDLYDEQVFLKAIDRLITPNTTGEQKPARNRKPTRKARNLQKRILLGLEGS